MKVCIFISTYFPFGSSGLVAGGAYCIWQHGSFGGPGLDIDEFYCNGSDDFRGYVWKIPPLDSLKDQRREVSVSNWASNEPPDSLGSFSTVILSLIHVNLEP